MFFDMDLLCRQRQGKFAIIWLAATRGIQTISRREVDQIDIFKICEELFKFVMSDSKLPRNRFSLYLSANLMHGIVLVYRKQLYKFEQSIVTFFCTIKRPMCIVNISLGDEKEKIKKRRSVPKKKHAIQAPDQPNEENVRLPLVEQQAIELRGCEEQLRRSLAKEALNTTERKNITIRDEVSAPPNPRMELFGDEGQIDNQLAHFPEEIPKTTAAVIDKVLEIPDQPFPLDQTLPPPTEIPIPDVSTLLPQEETTQKRLHSPTEELPTSKRHRASEVEVQEQPNELIVEVQPANVPLQNDPVPIPKIIATPRKRASVIRPRHNLNSSVKNWTGVLNISRPFKYGEIDTTVKKPESQRMRNVDPAEIMALLLSGLRFSDQDISAVVIGNAKENITIETSGTDLNTANDLSKRLTRDRAQTPVEVSVQELVILPPVQVNNEELVLEMIPDVQSPRLSCIMKPTEEITIIQEMKVDHGKNDSYRPRIHASTPLVFDTEYVRQQTLINHLRTLFVEEEHLQLTLWQIVFPLNRFRVAMTFSDLLHLQAKGYVILIPACDSNELQCIKPGNKLFK